MPNAVYKGLAARTLENDFLRLTFLPDYACKLASLVSKKTGREFLFQSDKPVLEIPPYGAPFSAYDSSGFDEVFPSIDACPYPAGPFQSVPVPDHGEVWAMQWKSAFSPDGKSAKSVVKSERFPYTLSRTATLNGSEILFEYAAENASDEPFEFIWTPHCLLACSPATKLLIPEHLNRVMTVEHSTKRLGPWGTLHSYPLTVDVNGQTVNLADTEPASAQNCEKFYFTSPNTAGWCGVEHTDTGEKLLYEYPTDKVPYLGVWKTQGGYRGDYNIALEPCTGVYDDLYVAHKIRRAAVIAPRGTYAWTLKMTVN